MQGPLIGVLALQGAFAEHQKCLEAIGCRTRQVCMVVVAVAHMHCCWLSKAHILLFFAHTHAHKLLLMSFSTLHLFFCFLLYDTRFAPWRIWKACKPLSCPVANPPPWDSLAPPTRPTKTEKRRYGTPSVTFVKPNPPGEPVPA